MSTEPSFCRTQCNKRMNVQLSPEIASLGGSVLFHLICREFSAGASFLLYCEDKILKQWQENSIDCICHRWPVLFFLNQQRLQQQRGGRLCPDCRQLQRCRNCSAAAVMTLQLHRRDQYDFPCRCWPGTRSHHCCSRHHNSGSQRGEQNTRLG